jgi:hypothetical protein
MDADSGPDVAAERHSYERVADLPLRVDDHDLAVAERETMAFTRKTTTVSLSGDGHEGRGEDVTYEADEHDALVGAGLPSLAGEYTLRSFSAHLDDVHLFPAGPPEREVFRDYRRWAFESAALDLALRQAGTDLGSVVGREYDPVRFVVSPRLGDPPTTDRLEALLDIHDDLEFKLDADADWTDDLIGSLVETDAVRVVDLKGQYANTQVDRPADPDLYGRVIEAFPEALVEDPKLTDETRALLEPVAERVTWDAPVHSASDVEDLPWSPAWLNCKPSRFGTVERLFEFLDYCAANGIDLYGGGQFELSVGRGQIQLLASLYYPDGPNDVAPGGYNDPQVESGLPGSPLSPPGEPVGFRWS